MAPRTLVAALATGTMALPARALGTAAWKTRPLLAREITRPRARTLCSAVSVGPLASQLRDPTLFRQQAYVDGQWMDASSGDTFSVSDPATGELLGVCADMGCAETVVAIAAAKAALPGWSGWTGKERAAVLRRWYELMMANQHDLALIMTREQGKPLAESLGEISYAASFCEWFGEEAKRVAGQVLSCPTPGRRIVTMKQPVGVAAAITPWNFPSAMITRKAAPALAAGCTMVVKPSDLTPYSALALCELAHRAGVPPGVLSVVTASVGNAPAVGDAMCASSDVRKLSFTGSTAVGKLLMRQCSGTVKRLSLELGGNAPFIVFDDCDLDKAVEGAVAAKFRNAGQTCVCTNRLFVQRQVHQAFVAKFATAVSKLKLGIGTDPSTTTGPLINPAAVTKVEALVADAVTKGATVVVGGSSGGRPGNFFAPTVLDGCDATMLLATQEIFGPVAPIFVFDTEAEAIAAANDTPAGLAAYCFTRDLSRAWRVAERLEYGIVGVNAGVVSNEVAPFGGFKESGLGREGSSVGIDEYLEVKSVTMAVDDA
mmetsp:Transcript_36026/g.115725  ORF Transcript_36026/g.115725 Transcript_36026/m.115725 type:complete len:544 (+) Transcript_36026:57-1688(+)